VPTPVAPGEDGAVALGFADLTVAQRDFTAASVTLDVRWSGPPNADLAIALSGSDEGFAGVTIDGPGSGGDVAFRDDAPVPAVQLPPAEGRGFVGTGRPDEPLSNLSGEPLGDGWVLVAVHLGETTAAQIEACELTVVAVPPEE
jgi:hypothetical protein